MIHVGDKLVVTPDKKHKKNKVKVQEPAVTESSSSSTNSNSNSVQTSTTATSGGSSAQEWIASRESGGSYTAQNGRYIGKYQLDASYLNGDYSPANQERVAAQYAQSRYGSWEAAQAFWQAHGWW